MKPIQYPVPWDQVYSLWPHVANGTQRNVDDFSARIVAKMLPPPIYEGLENLPASPRFLLVANHYQRQGLWIIHVASALTQAVAGRYGREIDPPVRWVVTANWPPIKIGKWKIASPGDGLLPKVANALSCYPVSFAGNNPAYTAGSIKRILRDAAQIQRPIGLFPEGVAGVAGQLTDPLPGVERLIALLAKRGVPAIPVGVSESGRFLIRFGRLVGAEDLVSSPDSAKLLLSRVQELI